MIDWGSPIITNALLLALLVGTFYRAPLQRLGHKTKRAIKQAWRYMRRRK